MQKNTHFITPEQYTEAHKGYTESPRGRLLIAACRSGSDLPRKVVDRYNRQLQDGGSSETVHGLFAIDMQFSDTETVVRLEEHVGGSDVFLFHSLYDPVTGHTVSHNYMTFLIAVRAFREHGANKITGILPYLAYGRQDKPTAFKREPGTARLMADLTIEAGVDKVITWEPHCGQIRGYFGRTPVNMLDSLTLFIDEFDRFKGRDDVIAVAPDAGASKYVTYFGRAMDVKCAIASKFRPEPEVAEISEIIGDFSGKTTAIILDDMISSGGTVEALIKKLHDDMGIREIYLGVSHNLCLEHTAGILASLHASYGLKEVVVTNSIPQTEEFTGLDFFTVRCLSQHLSCVINRIHYDASVSAAFYHP
ncbi:ribose-phosphate pyrophosphokinase [bacterium]|nr:ribose-phosphate pyrophosphokinase [bacterium]